MHPRLTGKGLSTERETLWLRGISRLGKPYALFYRLHVWVLGIVLFTPLRKNELPSEFFRVLLSRGRFSDKDLVSGMCSFYLIISA